MIVVDASLAAKWLLDEPGSDLALAFLQDHENGICGPDILVVEVASALVSAANARRIDRRVAERSLGAWLHKAESGALNLRVLDMRLLKHAADIALDLGHPLADCRYLALAIDIGAELATCDARFAAKARGAYPNVRLLSDYV